MISTCLSMSTFNTDFVIFLKDYNRCRAEIFSVNEIFNGLSNNISQVKLAQNFVFSTCLRYVDILQHTHARD